MILDFECPKCKGSIYELIGVESNSKWHKFACFHYVLNPGVAVNELVLGQRLPMRTLVCKACDLPLHERSYVPCTECGTLHGFEVQRHYFAFGNYFGLFCPSCNKEIPCTRNLTARVITGITTPLLSIPIKASKEKWLENRKRKLLALNNDLTIKQPEPKLSYMKMGIQYGFFMFLFCMIMLVSSFLFYGTPITSFISLTVSSFIICALGGLAFGYSMRWFMEKKGDSNMHLNMKELMNRKSSHSDSDDHSEKID